MIFKPRAYQLDTMHHMRAHPMSAIFLDMGLGKTISTLTVIQDLIESAEIRAALIVAPLRVVQLTWPAEVAKWDHARGLRVATVHGLPSQRRRALATPADVYLINYENIVWLCEQYERVRPPFDMVVWDESSKMKNPSAKRFKRIKPLIPHFSRRVLLTGTPTPKAYLDLWAQFFLLDRGARLEAFITRFRDNYFVASDPFGWEYRLREGAAERIEARIADITLSLSKTDHLDLPPVIVNRIELPLPAPLMLKYKALERDLFVKLDKVDVEAFNAAALSNKCMQLTAGVVYAAPTFDPEGRAEPQRFESIHTTKADAIAEIIDDAQGQSVMVCYWFKSELSILKKAFPKAEVLDGATSADEARRIVDAWNGGKVGVLLAHPASVGHGLNLQDGGHILVFSTLPWSLELYQQMVARLHRSGQAHPVMVHHLICPKTIDEAVESALGLKDEAQRGLLNALKAYRNGARTPTFPAH